MIRKTHWYLNETKLTLADLGTTLQHHRALSITLQETICCGILPMAVGVSSLALKSKTARRIKDISTLQQQMEWFLEGY